MENRDLWYGKMYREHLVATRGKILGLYWKRLQESNSRGLQYLNLKEKEVEESAGIPQETSWEMVTALPGGCLMHNIGELPSVENVSTLSQILMENAPEKYYLSQKACSGILRRAQKRGKELPEALRIALEKQAELPMQGGEPITLKIRSGCDGGGKGALMQIDKSATLGTRNDQTLFEAIPIADKATRHSGGGNTRNEDGAGNGLGIGAPGAPAYTLTAGDRHGVAYCLQGNMIGRAEKNGPQGNGVNEDVCFTLNTTDRHAVAYSFDKAAYNQGENSTYGIGLMEEVSHTLTAGWQPPAVACGIQQNASGEARSSETSTTLSTNGNASGRNAPLVAQAPTCTYDCRNHAMNEELSGTLQAKENGGYSLNYINPVVVPEIAGTLTAKMEKGTGGPAGDECRNMVVLPEYKIRRLTPLECCRLQGFPDGWTDGLSTAEPSEEKIDKWEQIFEEHRKITGEPKNPRKRAQIIKWLKNPYSDTALYKMWGNGIALPCAAFVLKGIAQELNT